MPRRVLRPSSVHQPTTYYSHGIDLGNVIYTAGQAPHDANGDVWDPSDVEGHIRAAFRNMADVLRAGNVSFENVARMTIFLRHAEHISAVWEVGREFLGEHRPAVTLAVVSGLAGLDYLIELDAIATK